MIKTLLIIWYVLATTEEGVLYHVGHASQALQKKTKSQLKPSCITKRGGTYGSHANTSSCGYDITIRLCKISRHEN